MYVTAKCHHQNKITLTFDFFVVNGLVYCCFCASSHSDTHSCFDSNSYVIALTVSSLLLPLLLVLWFLLLVLVVISNVTTASCIAVIRLIVVIIAVACAITAMIVPVWVQHLRSCPVRAPRATQPPTPLTPA